MFDPETGGTVMCGSKSVIEQDGAPHHDRRLHITANGDDDLGAPKAFVRDELVTHPKECATIARIAIQWSVALHRALLGKSRAASLCGLTRCLTHVPRLTPHLYLVFFRLCFSGSLVAVC